MHHTVDREGRKLVLARWCRVALTPAAIKVLALLRGKDAVDGGCPSRVQYLRRRDKLRTAGGGVGGVHLEDHPRGHRGVPVCVDPTRHHLSTDRSRGVARGGVFIHVHAGASRQVGDVEEVAVVARRAPATDEPLAVLETEAGLVPVLGEVLNILNCASGDHHIIAIDAKVLADVGVIHRKHKPRWAPHIHAGLRRGCSRRSHGVGLLPIWRRWR